MIRSVVSLFSGAGFLDLGVLQATGAELVAMAEKDEYCRALLAYRHPGVPIFDDVANVTAETVPVVDLAVGGFPCQPVSSSGKRKAQEDERWLWPEFARIVAELKPRIVFAENVEGLLGRGLNIVLGDLARLGYDVEWDTIPALAVGAPHLRYRVWIIARRRPDRIRGVFAGRSARASLDALPAWPDERDFLPRLKRDVPRRRERLTALGNGVVAPQARWVASRFLVDEEPTLGDPFATFDGERWIGRQATLFGGDELKGRWPYAGAVVDGRAYELAPVFPKRRVQMLGEPGEEFDGDGDGDDPDELRLWLTAPWSHGGAGGELQAQVGRVELWPTPTRADGVGGGRSPETWARARAESGGGCSNLRDAVRTVEATAPTPTGLWPTPAASLPNYDEDPETWLARAAEAKVRHRNGNGFGMPLGIAARIAEERDRGQLFPTPTASDAKGSRRATARTDEWDSKEGTTLTDAAILYPTPQAGDADRTSEQGPRHYADGTDNPTLLGAARRADELWPTPCARDYKGPNPNAREGGVDLPTAARIWPTPKASPSGPDYARVGREESGGDDLATAVARDNGGDHGGGLNPAWVEWLMGCPPGWTELPEELAPARRTRRRRRAA